MKNLIIIIGMIILGSVIFEMMAGDEPASLKSAVAEVMRCNVSQYVS